MSATTSFPQSTHEARSVLAVKIAAGTDHKVFIRSIRGLTSFKAAAAGGRTAHFTNARLELEMQLIAADTVEASDWQHLTMRCGIIPAESAELGAWSELGAIPYSTLAGVGYTSGSHITTVNLRIPAEISSKIKGAAEDSPNAAIFFAIKTPGKVKADTSVHVVFIADVSTTSKGMVELDSVVKLTE